MIGSNGSHTPFRYDVNYRNYYMVTEGCVKIKLAPPKSSKYLYPHNDYEYFEFISPINPWNVEQKYKTDFSKVKCLEISINPGKCFYIPAYWWYSFEFQSNSSICCFYYKTYMNNIAITPHIIMYFLQNQNVKHKLAKKIDIDILSTKEDNKNSDKTSSQNKNEQNKEKDLID
jgi:hypothetical protein